MTDRDLIQKYVEERSEEAFRELVERHLQLVFAAAYRVTERNRAMAEDVAQRTFCTLARKAPQLLGGVVLVGWLYRTAVNIARELMRAERRRSFYERQAPQMDTPAQTEETKQRFNAALDTALDSLAERDRLAILLRFFEQKSMHDVGQTLGISEDAAKMRVSRAVEKLRARFAKIGFVLPVAALIGLLSETQVSAGPALSASITATALRLVPVGTGFSCVSRILFMSAANKAAVATLLILVGSGVFIKTVRRPEKTVEQASAPKVVTRSTGIVRSSASGGVPSLDEALLNLRNALEAPPESRRIPNERVDRALAAFIGREEQAVPVLLEVLKKPRREVKFVEFLLAAHGLQTLGTKASSALPDVLEILRQGDLAILNDDLPRLLRSMSPDGKIVPDLIEALNNPTLPGAERIGAAVNELIAANPGLEPAASVKLKEMLQDADTTIQRNAACIMAGLPTQKDSAALPVLIAALNIEKVRDPKAYEPLVIPSENTTIIRDGEKWEDDAWRGRAIRALREFGPGAKEALPLLREMADLIPDTNLSKLRQQALSAIAVLDPENAPENAIAQLNQQKRTLDLIERAKGGVATYDELVEALQNDYSAGFAAQQLQKSPDLAKKALDKLQAAADRFDDYTVTETIGKIDPALLVERLKSGNTNGLHAVAEVLGDLGPGMAYATPYLEKVFADMKRDDPAVLAVGEALEKINPGYPRTFFHWDDLHDATSALLNEIYRTEKIRSPVYETYIRDFQDINNVSRPQLFKFIEATRADPDLYRVFVTKLLEKNPSLAPALQQKTISSR